MQHQLIVGIKFNLIFTVLLIINFITSCTSIYQSPVTVQPCIRRTGEAALAGGTGYFAGPSTGSFAMKYEPSIFGYLTYSPVNHLILGGDFFSTRRKYGNNNMTDFSKHKSWHVLTGYYKSIRPDSYVVFSLLTGFGKGLGRVPIVYQQNYTSENHGNYTSLYIQPDLSVYYYKTSMFSLFLRSNLTKIINQYYPYLYKDNKNNLQLFIEPGFTIKGGTKPASFFFQMNLSINSIHIVSDEILIHQVLNFYGGITVNFIDDINIHSLLRKKK